MDEARNIKSILYPLARDVRNLHTFVANINNILQAEPERFALAAPPGLASLRNTLRSLTKSIKAMQEVNDIAIEESAVAEKLAARSMTLVLRPAAHLHDTVRALKQPLDRAFNLVARLNGYLNPLFVFTVSTAPVVDLMARDLEVLEQRLSGLKRSVARLSDQELISGLPQPIEDQLGVYGPRFKVMEKETADVANQMALLMGKMNHLVEISARLEPLMRMAVALNSAIDQLVPSMVLLKKLGKALANVQTRYEQEGSLTSKVDEALAELDLPMDALIQLEYQLQQEVDSYIDPILEPLQELTAHIKGTMPNTHELNGLESTLLAQHNRFNVVLKMSHVLFDNFDHLLQEYRLMSHVA
ncbi:hypothetical protein [Ketobacter alkanivorans]|uniref:Uncharacterized protein n=1 Tax=Ketobacter alkanivorans TaxID=1917421 RepID=A0A2K9LMV9_9GAMM|nr:hypothetical protein [Ketobacter alkanivorans]AUM13622.1 hypothetical protein Kalk_14850 [Ketobacter alkanivorans]MCP5018273.1 hypothetical protein [Ketobacter sp.]